MALTIDELNIQIEANSKNATKALTALIKKLEKLNTVLSGSNVSNITITNSFNKTTNAINKTTTATKKHDEATKNSAKSTKSFTDRLAQNISKWRTLYSVFQNAANTMSEWFTSSNDYVETLNLFNVTMGDAADSAKNFADSVSEAMGIDVAEWMNYQGTFKQLTSGFGIVEDKANIMSQNLTQLSYDLASFFNTDVETAFDKLSSAMAGQVKGLREFGIDTTVASLQEYALAQGIDKSVRSMTQAEKSMLRYNYIMENSIKIQGDMARTIATPANAIRILTALLTQMKRALGNIVSVIVVKFIPYVQALVQIVTEAANAIANFLGYELPTIDYSGLGSGFSDEFEDAEDSLDGVSDGIKAIKKQLMGFDELNIISNPDTSSSSASGGTVGGGVMDMTPIEYDFLEGLDTSKAKEIYNTLKKMLTPMKRVWGYLVDYQDTIKTIAVVIAGLALVKKIKTLATTLAGFNLVNTFLNGFSLIKTMGGNFFQSFVGGLDSIRYSLSTVQKVGITAAAALIGFVTIKDSVKSLALGCEDVGAKMGIITVALGAMGVAMYTALGPWGLLLAAVVGVTGALVGVNSANKELVAEFANTAFFDGYGIAIGDLTEILKNLWDSTAQVTDKINDLGEKVKSNDDVIASSQTGITTFQNNLITVGTVTAEQAQKMSDDVKNLAAAIQENLGYNTEIIFTAFAKVSRDTADQLGFDVAEMTTILNTFKQTFSEKTSELESVSQGYLTRLANGEILSDSEIADLNNTLTYLSEMSGKTYENQQKVKRAMETLTDVNFGSLEEAQAAIADMAQLGKDMEADLTTAYESSLSAIDTMMGQAEAMFARGDLTEAAFKQFANVMANYKDGIAAGYEEEKENIQSQLDTTFSYIEGQINKAALETYDKALTDFDGISMWQKLFVYGFDEFGREKYAADVFEATKTNTYDPMYKALEEVGRSAETVGKTTIDDFYDSLLDSVGVRSATDQAGYYNYAKETVESYRKAVEDNTQSVTDAFEKMTQAGINAVKESQDSNSPAKEYISLAKDAIDGYTKGVEDNFHYIADAFEDGFESVFEDISKQAKSMFSTDTWSGYAKNITNALANVKTPQFKNIGLSVSFDTWVSADKEKVYKALGLSGFPKLSWYTYANGGFPSMGEMFIAREAGPELVGSIGSKTAVANNDQIVDGIANGVYRAMMAANGNGSKPININATLTMDGEVIGKKVIKYHNGVVMQTGESPLMV